MVKKLFYILVLFLVSFSSEAQRLLLRNMTTFDDKKLHFGFTLGVNTTDFNFGFYPTLGENQKIDPFIIESIDGELMTSDKKVRADITSLTPGFTVGIVSSLRLSESFDLRFLPGMSFGERKLVYNIPIKDFNAGTTTSEYYSIKSTFLDFPLLVKYKSRRLNNQRPYLLAGGAYRIDISKTGVQDLVRIKPISAYLEAGVGWDVYLQFFRLSTELKFSFGLDNVLDVGPDATSSQYQVYTNALSRLSSNIFTLSFHFE